MIKSTTDTTFEKDVLKQNLPVLVDFWAPWCAPCTMLSPTIESVSKSLEGKALVYKLNVDENPAMAQKYGITGIPTVMTFKNGKITNSLVGVRPKESYLEALQ